MLKKWLKTVTKNGYLGSRIDLTYLQMLLKDNKQSYVETVKQKHIETLQWRHRNNNWK